MTHWQLAVSITLATLAAGAGEPAPSPYAGMEERPIKALSPGEVESYRAGHGMGYAMAAELNSYPGPKHVLELAGELQLSEEQLATTRAAFDSMHAEAVRLGAEIVERERTLDRSFAEGTITEIALRDAVAELGRLQGELRFVHLRAHLEMRGLLALHQVHTYDRLRGYGAGHDPSRHQGRHGHGQASGHGEQG